MNQMTIGLIINPVKIESPVKGYREATTKSPNFEETMKQVSKKEELKSVETKEKIQLKKKKIDLESMEKSEEITPEEEILAILAEYLMKPTRELEQILEQVQMNTLDLMDQEKFGMFLTACYGQSIEGLLVENSQVKNIGELWESLQSIQKDLVNSVEQVTLVLEPVQEVGIVATQSQTINNGEIIQENRVLSDGTTQVTYKNMNPVEEENLGQTEEMIIEPNNLSALGLQIPIKGIGEGESLRFNNHLLREEWMSKTLEQKPISNQILNKLEVSTLNESKEIYMDLTPRELGKLSIKLVEGNGIFTAQIQVENEKTRELLLHNIQELKEGLEKQGMLVGDLDVNVRDQSKQSQMQQQKQKSTKRIEEIMAKHLIEIEEELKQEEQLPMSEVDLMA